MPSPHEHQNTNVRKVIGVALSVVILGIAWYGNYLPLAKSQAFITTLQSLGSARTLQDFEGDLAKPLDMPSPIGQEELVRQAASTVLSVVQQVTDPTIVTDLNKFIHGYYDPLIARGRGMSFEQDLYIMGGVSELSFQKTQNPQFLQDASNYYTEGNKLGPKRPQFLYGLFDVYRTEGNIASSTAVADQILSQWPTDTATRQALAHFLAVMASSTKPAPKPAK